MLTHPRLVNQMNKPNLSLGAWKSTWRTSGWDNPFPRGPNQESDVLSSEAENTHFNYPKKNGPESTLDSTHNIDMK